MWILDCGVCMEGNNSALLLILLSIAHLFRFVFVSLLSAPTENSGISRPSTPNFYCNATGWSLPYRRSKKQRESEEQTKMKHNAKTNIPIYAPQTDRHTHTHFGLTKKKKKKLCDAKNNLFEFSNKPNWENDEKYTRPDSETESIWVHWWNLFSDFVIWLGMSMLTERLTRELKFIAEITKSRMQKRKKITEINRVNSYEKRIHIQKT